jgi:hypothetical protein
MENLTSTIVFFHIGRGGRFNNAGYKDFCGAKNITEVLQLNDSGKNWNFISRENESQIYEELDKRGLTNLMQLFEKCRDNDDFSEFEKRTGLQLGEQYHTNQNGGLLISVAEAETGVGRLEWDGSYDTDICQYLHDCDQDELLLIANSNEWNKENLLQEFFNNHTDLEIDWSKFNDDYVGLIEEYFGMLSVCIEEYYNEEVEN